MRNDLPITVIGNLTGDPELRFTPSGLAVARFTVASTPRTFDKQSGEWRDGEVTFLDCTVWRQAAENVAESLAKGSRVVVAGRLRTERWETDGRNGGPAGEKRSRFVLDVDEVGASLQYATVTIRKATRSSEVPPDDPWSAGSHTRPAPAPAQAPAPAAAPTPAAAPAPASGGYSDEPPF